ncbi:MAG: hypothetical protein H7Y41_04270 [Hyphomonadaceae bacterium]|nr:hypothetical protein [Clostridia bacterium]
MKISCHPLIPLPIVAAFFSGLTVQFALFVCVLLWHELFHYIAARLMKISIHAVHFLPFGLTMVVSKSLTPPEEMILAIAGPLANLIACIVLWLAHWTRFEAGMFLCVLNFAFMCINLLPALPLDGGRFLLAWWSRKGRVSAYHRMLYLHKWVTSFCFIGGVAMMLLMQWNVTLLAIAIFLLAHLQNIKQEIEYVKLQDAVEKYQIIVDNSGKNIVT